MERRFDLKLKGGKVVRWVGKTGEDAARRYVGCVGGTVIATRPSDDPGVHVLGRGRIIG